MPEELFPFVFLALRVLNLSCRHYYLSENIYIVLVPYQTLKNAHLYIGYFKVLLRSYLNSYQLLDYHTVKSTVRRMNTPRLISFPTSVHAIFSCLWTVLIFLTWLYTRFWLYMMQKHPYFEKHSLSLVTRPVIRFATIYDRLSLTYESRMNILSSTLNRIESRRFISEKISAELDI